MLGRRGADESGAVVILVMAFLVVILVLVLAMFSMATTQTASTKNYRQERALRYAADGSLEAAIQMVRTTPALGSQGGPACSMRYAVAQDTNGGTVAVAMVSGSYVTVTCSVSPGTTGSGVVTAGSQAYRDVTFSVVCSQTSAVNARTPLACGAGGTDRTIATARVRYDIDYSSTTPATWATVPKILSYSLAG